MAENYQTDDIEIGSYDVYIGEAGAEPEAITYGLGYTTEDGIKIMVKPTIRKIKAGQVPGTVLNKLTDVDGEIETELLQFSPNFASYCFAGAELIDDYGIAIGSLNLNEYSMKLVKVEPNADGLKRVWYAPYVQFTSDVNIEAKRGEEATLPLKITLNYRSGESFLTMTDEDLS